MTTARQHIGKTAKNSMHKELLRDLKIILFVLFGAFFVSFIALTRLFLQTVFRMADLTAEGRTIVEQYEKTTTSETKMTVPETASAAEKS